jgi:hypothetical protein
MRCTKRREIREPLVRKTFALRASRDFTLIAFVKTKPTTIAIAQPAAKPQRCATIGATSSVIDGEAIEPDVDSEGENAHDDLHF